jgi:hypothetical protein
MTVETDAGGLGYVLDGDAVIAEGRRASRSLPVSAPDPVSLAEARAASAGSRFRTHPHAHPFPTCFVCGPNRHPGDGMRIQVGPVAGRDLAADVWYPDTTLADPNGYVRPEFLWAALDCAGGVGAMDTAQPSDPAFVLGRIAVRQVGPVQPGEPYVVVGWKVGEDGRKLTAGSAVFGADGQHIGIAWATWIQLRADSVLRPAATASRPW